MTFRNVLSYCFLAFAVVSSSIPDFPTFKQCDPRWGNDTMGVQGAGERDTICHQGCAMSSLAMSMRGYGFVLPNGIEITPGTLNHWLVDNHGYRCLDGNCNNLVLDAADALTGGKIRLVGEWGGTCCGGSSARPMLEEIKEFLSPKSDRHVVVIAHVRNSSHFILLNAWNETAGAFQVNDPGFNTSQYSFSSISDVIMYSVIPHDAYVPKRYPLFKQYDYQWKNNVMVSKTIGEVGCLMSSTSMALRANSIVAPRTGKDMDPAQLNAWLQANGGYDNDDDMSEDRIPALAPGLVEWSESIGMHRSNDVSLEAISASLAMSQPVIANVMHGRHFVLVVGLSSSSHVGHVGAGKGRGAGNLANKTTLYVNDPGFYRNTYDFANDVVGWRLFNMTYNGTGTPPKQRMRLEASTRVLRVRHRGPKCT